MFGFFYIILLFRTHSNTNTNTFAQTTTKLTMPVTVQQSIPMNSRGFFLRERDALNEQFGVQMKFPKGREFMHGNYQTMLMVGLQRDINSMMPQVRRILGEAQAQYESYKERQERRRNAKSRNQNYSSKAVDIVTTIIKSKVNPFAALEGLQEQEESESIRLAKKESRKLEKQAIANGSAPKTMVRPISTMNFSAMAAKPVAPKAVPKVKASSVGNSTVSWADMSDDEDWG